MSTGPTILVGFLGLCGVIITALITARTAAKTSTTATYADIVGRVEWLEQRHREREQERDAEREELRTIRQRLGDVEDDRDDVIRALRIIDAWDRDGRPDPPGYPGFGPDVRRLLDGTHSTA